LENIESESLESGGWWDVEAEEEVKEKTGRENIYVVITRPKAASRRRCNLTAALAVP